ncbi:MAG: hypothetical protein WD023_00780 [Ilumatobacteraceae bacterium]
MNTLDDDLRDLFARQADAMRVPTPILDQPLARVTSLDARRERRWLLPAAAVVLVAVGGVALAQRTTPDTPPSVPAAEPDTSGAPFSFETPTVRLSADSIEVVNGDQVSIPAAVAVRSDPGTSEFTSLELSWTDAGVERRLFLMFASDGAEWWASEIRTTDPAGEWVSTGLRARWFTSPLGKAWTGDVDLPNLRISGLTVEAFLRPAPCDRPTSPIAVVSAYPTIEGSPGDGFAGRIDLIDTSTCTPIDPTPYTFTAVVDDPSIVTSLSAGPVAATTIPSEMTTVPGVPPAPTTTILADSTGPQYDYDPQTPAPEPFGKFDLILLQPGSTTVRITVTDAGGAVIGSVAIPITVLGPPAAATTTIPASAQATVPQP